MKARHPRRFPGRFWRLTLLLVMAGSGGPSSAEPVDALASGRLAAPVEEALNLLANGSFEEGEDACPVDWVFLNQHQRTAGRWRRDGAHSGRQCVSVQGMDGLAYGRWATAYRLPLEPGRRYRLGFWHRGQGGAVKLAGVAGQFDRASGRLTEDLAGRYERTLAATEPSEQWRYYTAEFQAPHDPGWARLCLSGGGRTTSFFDDLTLIRDDLQVVSPRTAVLVETGKTFELELFAGWRDPRTAGDLRWEVESAHARLVRAIPDPSRQTWRLLLEATAPGVADLRVRCRQPGQPLRELCLERRVRSCPPLGKTFAFAVFSDAHLYRPGRNERNDQFARLTAQLNALDPLFGLGLGDQMDISSGATDSEKKWSAGAVQDELSRIRIPLYMVAGNHEVDKTWEGAGTRWYQEVYLGLPATVAFDVGGMRFIGLDTVVPGVYGRDHGGGLVRPGEVDWLKVELARGGGASFTVLWGHVSPYGEFPAGPDRDALLGLFFAAKARLFLAGHVHGSSAMAVRRPSAADAARCAWPKPTPVAEAAVVTRLDDPAAAVFLETTSCSAFLLGGSPYNGFRYLWVRDGRVAWQGIVPISLEIKAEQPSSRVRVVTVKNGSDQALAGFPVKAELPPGPVTVQADGRVLPAILIPGQTGQTAWVQLELPINATRRIEFRVPAAK